MVRTPKLNVVHSTPECGVNVRGRAPLCEFLGRPVPNRPFPSGNTPSVFQARMAKGYAASRANASRNFSIFVAVVIGTVALLINLAR